MYLGLGSNLGDRQAYLDQAMIQLSKNGCQILEKATVIETDPVGGPLNQDKYLNSVVKIKTSLNPENLLNLIHSIESKLDRIRTVKNGARTIDIDILLYDQLKINQPHLKIPHPRMFQRDFVLKPLKEICDLNTILFDHENI